MYVCLCCIVGKAWKDIFKDLVLAHRVLNTLLEFELNQLFGLFGRASFPQNSGEVAC